MMPYDLDYLRKTLMNEEYQQSAPNECKSYTKRCNELNNSFGVLIPPVVKADVLKQTKKLLILALIVLH